MTHYTELDATKYKNTEKMYEVLIYYFCSQRWLMICHFKHSLYNNNTT